jgi:serine protease Do
VNMRGEVIGINAAIVSRTGVNEGIGFAIPSNMVKAVMAQLIDKGKVTRGFLGVTIQNVDEKLAKSFNLPDTKGALVSGVSPEGPAAKAKLRDGDFIVSIDGKKVDNTNELRNTVAGIEPGKTIKVEFYREGKKQTADVKVEGQPADMTAMLGGGPGGGGEAAGESKFGLKVTAVTDDLAQQFGYKKTPKGVLISEVTPGSSAEDEGLKAGMVIVAVAGKDVTTPAEFWTAVNAKEHADGVQVRVLTPTGALYAVLSPAKATKEK